MRLVRYGEKNRETPGLLDKDGALRCLAACVRDIDGDALSPRGLAFLRDVDPASLPLVEGAPRLGPCVAGTRNFIAVGKNYPDHAREMGRDGVPPEPILFSKAVGCISGANDPIPVPRGSTKLDYEAELAFVIGTECRYVDERDAEDHIAGYCICNDVSERAFQLERQGQWLKGKSHDGFGPVGPFLATRDEISDPHALDISLSVNGETRQSANTGQMAFKIPALVAYVSRFMTLFPGDIVAAGTPDGVGAGFRPPRFLKEGDDVRIRIAGLGEQRQTVTTF
jgi:2-keto-4-pentenoate hydratase/2-oxohepta-3-ene-1,7-dioic acid hydratase in catechol pathway